MTRIHNSHSRGARGRRRRDLTPRKSAGQERSRATVEAILEATARILVRRGYDALNTNRVAEEAGVSVGTLYQYFPNKESLVAALLDRHLEETLGLLRREAPRVLAAKVPEAVRHFVELMIETHRVDPALHRVFVEQLPRMGGFERIEAVEKEGTALTRAYLEAHAAEIVPRDLDLAAFVVVTTIESLTHGAVLSRPDLLSRPEIVDEITACVVRYLTALTEH